MKTQFNKNLFLSLLWMAILFLPVSVQAQGLIAEHEQDGKSKSSILKLQSLDVDIQMTDSDATINERRTYLHHGAGFEVSSASIRFFRPLAQGVALSALSLNQEPWPGELLGPKEADEMRRKLVLQLHDPAPLGQMGTALFVSEAREVQLGGFFAPIMIELSVNQPLTAHGTLSGISVPIDWNRAPVDSMTVKVAAETDEQLRTIYSPYHPLSLDRADDHRMSGNYSGYQRCTAFDVTVLMATGDEPIRIDLLPFRNMFESGVYAPAQGSFLALLSAPISPSEESVLARDIVLVIDRSGSMQGEKMSQAKKALHAVMGGLAPNDNFGVVAFDAQVSSLNAQTLPATDGNVLDAQAFVDDLVADGGTNIFDALKSAFSAFPSQTGNPRYVVFMTDGQATEGETGTQAILNMAVSHNEVGARIYTFGIGYNVNTLLLDQLAKQSSGDALYITPGQAVDTAVESFFAQISDPVLSNPVLDVADIQGDFLYPNTLNDLFAGQSVAVLGQYQKAGTATVTLSGEVAGEQKHFVFELELPEHSVSESYVPRVWAKRRVGELLQELKLGSTDPAVGQEIEALAARYGVVTDFTHFQKDEKGDVHMFVDGVSTAASGQEAVNTSASIDSYQKGGSAGGQSESWIRYESDRTYPLLGGWYTDTALDLSADWTDIHFGSELYWSLLNTEKTMGIGRLLGLATNERFEFLGRRFRISDSPKGRDNVLPEECKEIPSAMNIPQDTGTAITWLENWDTPQVVEPTDELPGTEGEVNRENNTEPQRPIDLAASTSVPSCTTSNAPITGSLWLALMLLAALMTMRRRQSD